MRNTCDNEWFEGRVVCFCSPRVDPRLFTVLPARTSSGTFIKRSTLWEPKTASVPHSGFHYHPRRVMPVMDARNMPPSPRREKKPQRDIFLVSVAAEVALGIAGVVLCIYSKESILGPGFSVRPTLFGAAVLATIPLCVFSWCVGKANARVREITVAYCREIFLRRSFGEIAMFCACVAVGEELFFRSWLLQVSMHLFGVIRGQVGSSFLFGLCHGQSVTLIAASGISGYFFSWLFIGSGNSVALPVLVHFMYNLVSILSFKREIIREEKP